MVRIPQSPLVSVSKRIKSLQIGASNKKEPNLLSLDAEAVFSRKDEREKYLFKLLQTAYIDARYKKDYSITYQDLAQLTERVKTLHTIVKQACKLHLPVG